MDQHTPHEPERPSAPRWDENRTLSTTTTRWTYWERRPAGAMPWVVGGLGLLGIGLAYDLPLRHSMESALQASAEERLDALGAGDAKVTFSGRDAVLQGPLPAGLSTEQALEAIRGVEGVRIVTAADPTNVAIGPSASASATRTPTIVASSVTSAPTTVPSVSATTAPTSSGPTSSASTGTTTRTTTRTATRTSTPPSTPSSTATTQTDPSGIASPRPNKANSPVQAALNQLPQITFEGGTTEYTEQGGASVREAAAILLTNPTARVQIEGHTDDAGPAAVNLRLSQRRAEEVRNSLIALGVAPQRLTSVGYGEAWPKRSNTSEANRAVNRRVLFKVL